MRLSLKWLALAASTCFALVPCFLSAQSAESNNNLSIEYVTKAFDFLEDKHNEIPQESIFSSKVTAQFKSINSDKFSIGFTSSVFWLKTTAHDLKNRHGILEIDEPYLTSVSLYQVYANGSVDSFHNGLVVALEDQEIQTGSIAFQLTPKSENFDIYLRIESKSPLSACIRYYSQESWEDYQQGRGTIKTIFLTLFVLLSLGCIILLFMRRKVVFLYYFGAVICFSGVALYSYGFAKELWDFPLASFMVPVLIMICLACLLGVFKTLISLIDQPFPKLKKISRTGMVVFVVIAAAFLLLSQKWIFILIAILFPTTILFLIVVSFFLRKKGAKSMNLFLFGCVFLFLSIGVRAMDIFGPVVLSNEFKIFPLLFLLGQIVMFLLAFFYQSNVHQKARILAELNLRNSLSQLEYYRQKLEQRMPEQITDDSKDEIRDNGTTQSLSNSELNDLLLAPLSKRELDVLRKISKGLSNREAAESLFISVNTIKTHLNRIYEKLDVNNRTEAAIKAGEMSLLDEVSS